MFKSDQFISKESLLGWSQDLKIDLKRQTVSKNEVFLEHRYKCHHFYYVIEGFVRIYYLDLQGQERTHWFASEDMMFTSPFSFFKDEANILNFQALDDTELILISRRQIETICDYSKEASKATRLLLSEFAMQFSRRIINIHTQPAEYRYLKLLEEFPEVFQKANLSYIASYLGVTLQSLSRIRRNLIH